ncbi:hypothetical protein [Hydrogenophilus thermoluteolus]|uniref:hypothetical protein n=1 Tax=Hydrogenophilus thermoluteolus TaxID=297 RepID=UPI003F66B1ED
MTAFVMVVMAVSLAWLLVEGWRWWRAGQALAAHAGNPFATHLETRAWQQEIQQLRVVIATQQQQIAALQAEIEAIKGAAGEAASHTDVPRTSNVSPAADARAELRIHNSQRERFTGIRRTAGVGTSRGRTGRTGETVWRVAC